MTRISTAFFCAAALAAGPLNAAPMEWSVASGGNGHWYDLVAAPAVTWADAAAGAAGATHLGAAGHLATLTSAGEWAFLVDVINPGGMRAWLGGSDAGAEGQWNWVEGPEAGTRFWNGDRTGSAAAYHAWHPLEPNNASNEDYLVGWWAGPAWNDLSGTRELAAYVVEYSITAVPAPGGLPLMLGAVGMLALGLRRRG